MNTQEFLVALEAQEDRALIFDLGERRVAPGYHVTEVKALSVQAMDCGGQADAWSETVVQLWVPDSSDTHMRVSKFLAIYNRVTARVPTLASAQMRVEYGDVGAPAISYLVSAVEPGDDAVVVRLEPPAATCKAAERAAGFVPDALPTVGISGCCTPSAATDDAGLVSLNVEQDACCG